MDKLRCLADQLGRTSRTRNTFKSFDGIQIAYHDEGKGPAVILLHGGYLDGLSQSGDFERILPLAERRQETFHLRLDAVDVIGFSMGAGTAARLLLLRPPQVKSAILAGFGDYAIEEHVMEFGYRYQVIQF